MRLEIPETPIEQAPLMIQITEAFLASLPWQDSSMKTLDFGAQE